MDKIDSFRGEYYFLSNFYEVPVRYAGITYRNSEAAFQAQKTLDEHRRRAFANLTASHAKKEGYKVQLRPDWEMVKVEVMQDILRAKFMQNPGLKAKLIATGDAYLEEGNNWGDTTWGTVNGSGQNLLGKSLMELRRFLIQTDEISADERQRLKDENRATEEDVQALVDKAFTDVLENQHKPAPDKEGTLVVLQRSNGWFGGYLFENGEYTQAFNTDARTLFNDIRYYTDKGYSIRCVPVDKEAEFMEGRQTLLDVLDETKYATIWRYETAGPFQMGGPRRRTIAVKVNIHDYETVELEKGFAGLVVKEGPAKGIYELTSGGLVGDTVEEVNADILACDDMELMKKQIKDAAETALHEAVLVTKEQFGLGTEA